MKIDKKGQVTIPRHVRERHGFLPGTEVRFIDDGGEVRIVKADAPGARGRRIVEHMGGRGETRLSTEEIMELTRGDDGDGPGPDATRRTSPRWS